MPTRKTNHKRAPPLGTGPDLPLPAPHKSLNYVRLVFASSARYSMRVVPQLQSLLGKGCQAAETLREVFANNAEVLDMVTDEMILMFVRLIRETGRQARFVEFLRVLCTNNGKAVRRNQWRVCRFFLQEAAELHIKMRLHEDGVRVLVSADAQYFPAFVGAEEVEVAEWLDSASTTTAAYFERCIALYEVLAAGRNQKNMLPLADFLPYPVVLALVRHQQLQARHLEVCTQFVGVARSLYVDNEPHQQMVRVRPIRMWENIATAARSGKLSSRLVSNIHIDWHQFDGLKDFVGSYLSRHAHRQVATAILQNRMSLELMQLLHSLVDMGFYTSTEVAGLLPNLLNALDGTSDRVGLAGSEAPTERYKRITTIRCNTVDIMQAKLWCCKVLQLVVTMRLDIRLSHLLHNFQEAWKEGEFGNGKEEPVADLHPALAGLAQGARNIGKHVEKARRQSLGYLKLTDEADLEEDLSPKPIKQTFDVLRLDARSSVDIVHVLLDLSFYEHHELVTASMGLLVRHFEQRHVLLENAREVRLLVKPAMVALYSRFDSLMRSLHSLAQRYRLFDNEPYEAVRLMSLFTMHCYEESEDGGGAGGEGKSATGHSHSQRSGSGLSKFSAGAGSAHYTASHGTLLVETNTAQYAHLVGKGVVHKGQSICRLQHLESGERHFRRGDKLELEGRVYTVKTVDAESQDMTLDRRVDLGPRGEGVRAGDPVVVWLFIVCEVGALNTDVQSLLYSMNAQSLPLTLVQLPFEHSRVRRDELDTRLVLKACYRMLKAMTSRFPLTQNALVAHVPVFLAHTEAQLVASDISPTECISAVYKDNSIVCTQVSESMVRHFVRLAAIDHAPRYLRFLGMLVLPQGRPARRCQNLVVQCLLEKEDALMLYNDEEGMALRAQLVEENDHVKYPRGRLAYHMELVALLAKCIEGAPSMPIVQVWPSLPPLAKAALPSTIFPN